MSPKLKALPLAVAQLIAAGAFSGLTAAPALAQMGATPIERITVTGTNIRRTDTETPSEVQVITREQMIQSGLHDRLAGPARPDRQQPGYLDAKRSPGRLRPARAPSRCAACSLGATLVLIDGYRMTGYPLADDGQRNFVDISTIPFVAVDRIEVLLDGASAIYGSDAIAGVVNVILKKDFKGINGHGDRRHHHQGRRDDLGRPTHAGLRRCGSRPGRMGRGRSTARRKRSTLSQRQGEPWNVMDYSSWGGNNLRPGARSASVTNPVIGEAPYLQSSASGANLSLPANNAFLNSNCDLARRNANQCTYDNTWGQIQPRTQNVNLIGNLSGRFATDWSYSITGSYFDSRGLLQHHSFAGSLRNLWRHHHRRAEPASAGERERGTGIHGSGELSGQHVRRARVRAGHLARSRATNHQYRHGDVSPRGAGDRLGVGVGHQWRGGLDQCRSDRNHSWLHQLFRALQAAERPGAPVPPDRRKQRGATRRGLWSRNRTSAGRA